MFGLVSVWREGVKVPVSSPSRTLVDLVDDPRLGGGMRHVSEVAGNYFGSEHRKDSELVDLLVRLGNGTAFKRLGYLVEALGIAAPEVVEACRERMSAGVSTLDPSGPSKGQVLGRWRLRVNVGVGPTRS
jgi:predicted transcriptional regulator of viral defense system